MAGYETYTSRQQQELLGMPSQEGRQLMQLVFEEANKLYEWLNGIVRTSHAKFMSIDDQEETVNLLRELNASYWNGSGSLRFRSPSEVNAVRITALRMQHDLEKWQWVRNLHEEVIGELELLVGESAVAYAATR